MPQPANSRSEYGYGGADYYFPTDQSASFAGVVPEPASCLVWLCVVGGAVVRRLWMRKQAGSSATALPDAGCTVHFRRVPASPCCVRFVIVNRILSPTQFSAARIKPTFCCGRHRVSLVGWQATISRWTMRRSLGNKADGDAGLLADLGRRKGSRP
jgi:hypothetical protein